jgi:hypothetical protein
VCYGRAVVDREPLPRRGSGFACCYRRNRCISSTAWTRREAEVREDDWDRSRQSRLVFVLDLQRRIVEPSVTTSNGRSAWRSSAVGPRWVSTSRRQVRRSRFRWSVATSRKLGRIGPPGSANEQVCITGDFDERIAPAGIAGVADGEAVQRDAESSWRGCRRQES